MTNTTETPEAAEDQTAPQTPDTGAETAETPAPPTSPLDGVDMDGLLAGWRAEFGLNDAQIEELERVVRRRFEHPSFQDFALSGTNGIMAFFQALLGMLTGQHESMEAAFAALSSDTGSRFNQSDIETKVAYLYDDIARNQILSGNTALAAAVTGMLEVNGTRTGLTSDYILNRSLLGALLPNNIVGGQDVAGPTSPPPPSTTLAAEQPTPGTTRTV